jgi:demethylmenaquinone methyltransferase/2-methoxy-6-polyprenyl-1,4-benzoquinol methylase/ArsR family transcriptional regulator
MQQAPLSFNTALGALGAAGEETRLRLLALLSEAELTVSELVTILGQSQPRISRHLKLLAEAGLVVRHREGSWAFFLAAPGGAAGEIARAVAGWLDPQDPILVSDRARLGEVRRARDAQAARYFAAQAPNWDKIRALHVPEERVETALREIVGTEPVRALLDLGTGTGRMLEVLVPLAERAVGIDQSPAMLAVARARLERAELRNVQLRQGDIYAIPVERNGYDLVVLHQVLHYLDDPVRALREAARVLRPGGRLLLVDFAPHTEEALRESHAHRRLGFDRDEIASYLDEASLDLADHRDLPPLPGEGGKLTVSLWLARDRRIQADPVPLTQREVA